MKIIKRNILCIIVLTASCATEYDVESFDDLSKELNSFDNKTSQEELDEFGFKFSENITNTVYNSKISGQDYKIIDNVYDYMKKNNLTSSYKNDFKYRLFGIRKESEDFIVYVRSRFVKNEILPPDLNSDSKNFTLIPMAEYKFVVSGHSYSVIEYFQY